MIVKTRTSRYELTKQESGHKYKLEKISQHELSAVGVGRVFFADETPWINSAGGLEFGQMNTSPLQNLDEVAKFLKSQ